MKVLAPNMTKAGVFSSSVENYTGWLEFFDSQDDSNNGGAEYNKGDGTRDSPEASMWSGCVENDSENDATNAICRGRNTHN